MSLEDKRAEAVTKAWKKVRKIMEGRDQLNAIREFLLKTDPEFVYNVYRSGRKYPKYIVDLLTVLSKLYDDGYANASSDLEKFK